MRKREGRRRLLVPAVVRGLHPRDALDIQSVVLRQGVPRRKVQLKSVLLRCVVSFPSFNRRKRNKKGN